NTNTCGSGGILPSRSSPSHEDCKFQRVKQERARKPTTEYSCATAWATGRFRRSDQQRLIPALLGRTLVVESLRGTVNEGGRSWTLSITKMSPVVQTYKMR